jgi:hypothetical protein
LAVNDQSSFPPQLTLSLKFRMEKSSGGRSAGAVGANTTRRNLSDRGKEWVFCSRERRARNFTSRYRRARRQQNRASTKMIPLSRHTAHKNLEATLLSHSKKQAGARLSRAAGTAHYSTPSKPANAQAALAQAPANPNRFQQVPHSTRYTFIPTPLPEDRRKVGDAFFPDSNFLDLLAVMNACLHNCYDVRRALGIFEDLRVNHKDHPSFDVHVYNKVLEACLGMIDVEPSKSVIWIEDFYEYFDLLNSGKDGIVPNATTYALAMRVLVQHGALEDDDDANSTASYRGHNLQEQQQPKDAEEKDVHAGMAVSILKGIVKNEVDVQEVVTDRTIPSDEVAGDMVRELIKATTHKGFGKDQAVKNVALLLVKAEKVARHMEDDVLESVEDVAPVRVSTVSLC